MKHVRDSESELLIRSRALRTVNPHLCDCLNHKLGWRIPRLWSEMLKYGAPDGPDISGVYRTLRKGYTTEWIYEKMEIAYKVGLSEAYVSTDPRKQRRVDPKVVPMIDDLNTWPSEALKEWYYKERDETEARKSKEGSKKKRKGTREKNHGSGPV